MKSIQNSVKYLLIALVSFAISDLYAQNGNSGNPNGSNGQGVTQWKTNGNIVDSNQFIGSQNYKPLIFKTNGSESLRIDSDGNLGLGTASPETKLDVNGSTTLRSNVFLTNIGQLTSSNAELIFKDGTGALKQGGIGQLADLIYDEKTCPQGPITSPIWANGVNKIFVNCPQIYVGISTNEPRVSLDVIGTSYLNRLALGNSDPVGMTDFFSLTAPYLSATLNKSIFSINNVSTQVFNVNNNGTTTTITLDNKLGMKTRDLTIDMTNSSGTVKPLVVFNDNYKLLQLEPDGLLRSRRIKVDVDSWSDYVFSDAYSLMPLNDVRNYINQYHHLPSVPSEEEVKENGIDLAEMNAILLKKIEEMTLYILDHEDEMEKLKQEIEMLKLQLNSHD